MEEKERGRSFAKTRLFFAVKSRKYIFLEYFIIEEGVMWEGMHRILKQKAAEGLDVRVMYDDLGSIRTLPPLYAKKLENATETMQDSKKHTYILYRSYKIRIMIL